MIFAAWSFGCNRSAELLQAGLAVSERGRAVSDVSLSDALPVHACRLTYLGYDYLAIHTLVKQGAISSVGRQIGVGKESDVFEVRLPWCTRRHGRRCRLSATTVWHAASKQPHLPGADLSFEPQAQDAARTHAT